MSAAAGSSSAAAAAAANAAPRTGSGSGAGPGGGAAAAAAAAYPSASSQPDFLTLILEIDPRRLIADPAFARLLVPDGKEGASAGPGPGQHDLFTAHFLPALLIFLNAHIALQHGNGLAIYLATPTSPTRLIYTSAPGRLAAQIQRDAASESMAAPDPNTYQHFDIVNRALWAAVRTAVQDAAAARPSSHAHARHSDSDHSDGDRNENGDADEGQPRRKRRRRTRRRHGTMTGTGPLVSALSQALAHLNNIPPSSSSSSSSAAQASSLPSGHSATILPRASASVGPAKSTGAVSAVAGGGLSSWRPRILILSTLDGGHGPAAAAASSSSAATEGPGTGALAYVPLMNCIFAAQKRSILIDVLKLCPGQDVVFLQQAAHLTGGNYLRLDLDEKGDAAAATVTAPAGGRKGAAASSSSSTTSPLSLLQVLMTTFLPSRDLRYFPPNLAITSTLSNANANASGTGTGTGAGIGILRLPTLDSVDFRAACFCHRTVVDVGYVCSVCLSIFCEPRKECLICGSRFPRATTRRFADEGKVGAALVAFEADAAATAAA